VSVTISLPIVTSDGLKLDGALHSPPFDHWATVVLVHGIGSDKNGGGLFIEFAYELARSNARVFRFSFRGHGSSDGIDLASTVAGMLKDLDAAVTSVTESNKPIFLVAASFGAVPALLLESEGKPISGIVLWNPVLNIRGVFYKPKSHWGIQHFGISGRRALIDTGYVTLESGFRFGAGLYDEIRDLQVDSTFLRCECPMVIFQAKDDRFVSYRAVKRLASRHGACSVHAVKRSSHMFEPAGSAAMVMRRTIGWLREQAGEDQDRSQLNRGSDRS
jgi:uncharacterized protein